MGSVDIRSYKNELRAKYRAIRKALTPQEKREKDELIFRQIVQSRYYQQAETLICFVSTAIEIDTHRLIHHAWRQGKRVAVPKCLDDRGRMRFYYIRS